MTAIPPTAPTMFTPEAEQGPPAKPHPRRRNRHRKKKQAQAAAMPTKDALARKAVLMKAIMARGGMHTPMPGNPNG